MAKTDLKRTIRTRCPHCSDMLSVPLILGDKGLPITCPSCGGHVATMGELLDATIEQVAAILRRGLEQRLGRD